MKHSRIAAILVVISTLAAGNCPTPVARADAKDATNDAVRKTCAKKPIIGVNCDINGDKPRMIGLSAPYVQALKNAGAIPVLLPPMSEEDLQAVLANLDGVLMIGGADYPPNLYGQKVEPTTVEMDEERWRFDILLAKTVVDKTKLPFLGICAGSQALNVSRGGSLIQDIPTKLPAMKVAHASKDGWQKGFNKHEVSFAKLTKLKSIYGIDRLSVPTSHHQCVDRLGDDLQVAAIADDGMVEAVELKGNRFVFGVQWHPERDFSANQKLFKDFINAARNLDESTEAGKTKSSETAGIGSRFTAE